MKKFISFLFITAMILTFLAGCNDKANTFDVKNFANIGVDGLNGRASVRVSVDMANVNAVCENIGNDKGLDAAFTVAKVFETLKFKIVSNKQENLSNGDEVKITATYSEAEAKNAKLKFTNTEFIYTVEGLEEGTYVDPFEVVEIVYSGISPEIAVEAVNRSEEQYIRDIDFSVSPSQNLRIGDKFIVTVKTSPETAAGRGLIFPDEIEKEYTVEGVDEYIKTFDELDEKSKAFMEKESIDYIESRLASSSIPLESPLKLWSKDTLESTETELVKIYFLTLKPGISNNGMWGTRNYAYNRIYYVYKISVAHNGEEAPRVVYPSVYFDDVIKQADGSVSVDASGLYISTCESSIEETYNQSVTKNKDSHEAKEIEP